MVMSILWFYGHVYFVTCGLRLKLASELDLASELESESKFALGFERFAQEFAGMERSWQTCMKIFGQIWFARALEFHIGKSEFI